MFEVRDISFAYDKDKVLNGVNFSVAPSSPVAIVGANGAGKTTLLKILAGLACPLAGSAFLDNRNVSINTIRYRKQLGYMPEKIALSDDMKVREYLIYRAVIKGEVPRRATRRVDEVLKLCSLSDFSRKYAGDLSAGLKKMISLADAILLKPRILLIDDPYSGLDVASRNLVTDILSTYAQNSSVIVTGHEIEELSKWVDSFLVLEKGAISKAVSAGEDRSALGLMVRKVLEGGE